MEEELATWALRTGNALQQKGYRLVSAESCTGGWLAKVLTDIPGSSAWFERGYITYSKAAKSELLDVSVQALAEFGAVSAEIAQQMAAGALARSQAHYAVAITGIAGPDGGTPEKPVGLVCFAWAARTEAMHSQCVIFNGDRAAIRAQAVVHALRAIVRSIAP